MAIRIVVASTASEAQFWSDTYLGRSLTLMPKALRPKVGLESDNTGPDVRGLPAIYNAAIDAASDNDVLVLMHDDVWIHDWFFVHRVAEAADAWDIAGVAGAVDPDLTQPSWYWSVDSDLNRAGRQSGVRSGAINHADLSKYKLDMFGPTPARCLLLDGVLMIVNVGRVRAAGIRFDERFFFHMYDIDFCRAASAAGLRLGTWPIALSHASGGVWDSDTFKAAAISYLTKWQAEPVASKRWWRRPGSRR